MQYLAHLWAHYAEIIGVSSQTLMTNQARYQQFLLSQKNSPKRESKDWSQQKLENEAFGRGHRKSTDLASSLRMYQKIEKTGHISRKRA